MFHFQKYNNYKKFLTESDADENRLFLLRCDNFLKRIKQFRAANEIEETCTAVETSKKTNIIKEHVSFFILLDLSIK